MKMLIATLIFLVPFFGNADSVQCYGWIEENNKEVAKVEFYDAKEIEIDPTPYFLRDGFYRGRPIILSSENYVVTLTGMDSEKRIIVAIWQNKKDDQDASRLAAADGYNRAGMNYDPTDELHIQVSCFESNFIKARNKSDCKNPKEPIFIERCEKLKRHPSKNFPENTQG